jgi:hypothetical protein
MRLAYRSSHMQNCGSISQKVWARAAPCLAHRPIPEMMALLEYFTGIARERLPGKRWRPFTHTNPRCHVRLKKRRGFWEMYGATRRHSVYFTLHTTADVEHSQEWRQQFVRLLEKNTASADTRWPMHRGTIRLRTQESLGRRRGEARR